VTGSDTHHPRLFLECKLNAKSPFWRLYEKALPVAKKEKKVVVLCLAKKNHEGHIIAFHSNDVDVFVEEYLKRKGTCQESTESV
jgi:hypothetical protein